jgi:transposase
MKSGPDRRYTPEFRDAAVKQVIEGGRSVAAVARSLEMSNKSLANWVYRARKGQELVKRAPAQPVSELEAEVSRLRQENAKLKLEKEILKNLLRGSAAARWAETHGVLCQVAT